MSYRQWHSQEFPFVCCVCVWGWEGKYLKKYIGLLIHTLLVVIFNIILYNYKLFYKINNNDIQYIFTSLTNFDCKKKTANRGCT